MTSTSESADATSSDGDIKVVAVANATRKSWLLGSLAVLALQALVIGPALVGGSWFADDLYNDERVHGVPLSWSFVTSDIFGHLIPLAQVEIWWAAHNVLHHTAVMLAELGVILATTALFIRLLFELVGDRRLLVLSFAALYALSPLALPSVLWWSSAMCLVPAHFFVVLAMLCLVRWLHRPALWLLAVLAVATEGAICAWDIANLVVVWLPCLALAAGSGGLRARLSALLRAWPVWVALLVPMAAYQVLYAQGTHAHPTVPPVGQFLRLVGVGWHQGFLPGLLGGPLRWEYVGFQEFGVAAPPSVVAVLAEIVLVGLLVVTVIRFRQVWWAWLLVVLAVLPTLALVASGRLAGNGTSVGRDYHYLSLGAVPGVLGLALAVAQVWPVAPVARQPSSATASREGTPPVLAGSGLPWQLGAVLTAVALIAAVTTDVEYGRNWSKLDAGSYLTTLVSEVHEHAKTSPDGRVTLLDEDAPNTVLAPYPGARIARLAVLTPTLGLNQVDYDGASPNPYRVDAQGHLVPARLVASVPLHRPASPCVGAGNIGRLRLRPATPLQTTGEYVVRLHVSGRTRLSVTLWSGGKAASQLLYNAHAFRVPAGEHTVHVTSIGAAIDTVDVNFTTVTRTCITSGDVSQVDPL